MEKIDVNGPNTHPVWKWAKEQTKTGDVSWCVTRSQTAMRLVV